MKGQLIVRLVLSVAFVSGLYTWRYLPEFLRWLFLQLLVWISIYVLGHFFMVKIEVAAENVKTNSHIYNLGFGLEILILLKAIHVYFKKYIPSLVFWILATFCIVCQLIEFLFMGIFEPHLYSYSLEGLIISGFVSVLIYQQFHSFSSMYRSAYICVCLGLLLYFVVQIPYVSVLAKLNKQNQNISGGLFRLIVKNLADLRYLLLALSFWLARKAALKPISN
jgi:hypothetical protein